MDFRFCKLLDLVATQRIRRYALWIVAILSVLPTNSQVQAADPMLLKLNPRWIDGSSFWYSKPTDKGRKEFVWVSPSEKKILRAASLEELGKLAGVSLLNRSATGRIEPSETLEEARIDIAIKNALLQPVELFWIDFQGVPKPYGTLAPGESRGQSTFAGHSWAASLDGKKPIWTGQATEKGQVLEIQAMEMQAESLFPRREARRRSQARAPRDSDANRQAENRWKVERSDYQIRFISQAGKTVLDTADLGDAQGTETNRYDQPIFWSTNQQFAFTLQIEQGDRREIVLVESSPKDQLQPKNKT
ncbi:MAG: hypothetical protein DWH99_10775, partial [Planctomycetota bacterium]